MSPRRSPSSDREVEFRFDQKGNRELPQIIGDLVVLPKHWWEGTDANGKKRDITQPTLEPPLGSRRLQDRELQAGRGNRLGTGEGLLGADLPVNVGRDNFDQRRYVYFQDDNAEWQAFTKGGFEDIRPENSSRRWATGYNFPAFKAGDVIKREFEDISGEPMQGFVLNLRRPQFQDRRVRAGADLRLRFREHEPHAVLWAQHAHRQLLRGQRTRVKRPAEGKELEILNPYKDKLPPEVFTQEFKLPVYDTPQAERAVSPQGARPVREAGWKISGGKMVNDKGEQFRIEFLGNDPTDEVISTSFMDKLRKLGIDASLRIVDPSQYVNRFRNFDFDMRRRPSCAVAVARQRAARLLGLEGRRHAGFAQLIGHQGSGRRRADRARDLRHRPRRPCRRHPCARPRAPVELLRRAAVAPRRVVWLAYWNKFGIPDKQPAYIGADIDSWWIDPEKESALAAKYKSGN